MINPPQTALAPAPQMSAIQPQYAEGPGWTAVIHPDSIQLAVTPYGDVLPEALDVLIACHQQRYWECVLTTAGEGDGWDEYTLIRDTPTVRGLFSIGGAFSFPA